MTRDPRANAPLSGGNHEGAEIATGEPYDHMWLTSIARPALLILMVSMIDVALLAFLRQYVPDMAPAMGWTILGLGVLAASIGVTTTTWLALPDQRLRRSSGYRAAEIALLLTVAPVNARFMLPVGLRYWLVPLDQSRFALPGVEVKVNGLS